MKALTLNELRQMVGQPVWCPKENAYGIITCDKYGKWAGIPFLYGACKYEESVKGYYRGRYVCRKLYQPTESDQYETVYNLSVEEDESYIANGAIVHNCQDISVAGKQLGFQGNRSSLFFRVMYLIGQLEEENRPTYLFIENVKNLLSVNGGWDFARLLIEMDRGGTMRNGKCSTLRTSEFHKTEKGASLSDILEDEVPQKYFLSREQTEKIVFQ